MPEPFGLDIIFLKYSIMRYQSSASMLGQIRVS